MPGDHEKYADGIMQKNMVFSKLINDSPDISNAKKLGEGTYGEVFTAKHKGEPVAIKIIPAGGAVKVNDEPQNSFRDVQLELIVSKELAELKVEENGYRTEGFIQLITSCVCMGRYPKELLCAWDEYNIDEKSENDDPRMFPANQCYLILACEQGGSDLENYEVKSINQAYSIITQVITALAVAEDRLCYEHRDLHVGNVLVSECDDRFREELIAFHKVRVSTYGVSVKVIDFTCSRMRKGSSTIFLNLANDKALFEGKGDLQFDIYRLMKKANRNNWARFNPKTNVMWIVYLTRYINAKLEENQIGTAEERERFVRLFQSMHRFGRLFHYLRVAVFCSNA
ncbi:unnamed protein product [Toxocara canis]|uniref:non-specific serine/threonine protein kinase n=1 Tax=Toxocara canis TaxID=6265 RepID=A0A183UZU8_TOXCA|nr:unnamed protein product [Toxocara canis]